ncbi:uncharacterized protein [Amphiura filiformis]|uniref:uncharacterized protein n=1 Tax=Amphiura filiformis TaxID=82378 RepID=UPI003B21CC05
MDNLITFATTMLPNTSPRSNLTSIEFGFHDKWQRILLGSLLLIASLAGTIGNSLIILAVLLSRKLRSPTNVFVVNLSVADLLTCLALPWNIVALLSFDGWPLANWVCTCAAIVTYVPIFSSVSTLAAIAINRLLIITQPIRVYKKIFCNEVLITWIIFLWIWPFIFTVLPPLAGDFGSLGYNEKFHSCSSISSHKFSDDYDLLTALIIYPIPLIIIIACYIKIFIHVRRKEKKLARHKSSNIRSTSDNAEDSISLTSIDDISLPPSPSSPNTQNHTQFPFPERKRYIKGRNGTPPPSPLAARVPSVLSASSNSSAMAISPSSPNTQNHTQFPFPESKKYVKGRNGTPPSSPLAASEPAVVSASNSSPVVIPRTVALKLAEELAESPPSTLPRSNSSHGKGTKINRSVSMTQSSETTTSAIPLEKWPRALSLSETSLNSIGTQNDRPLSSLPHSRTAAVRVISDDKVNSLPTRRGASLNLKLSKHNSYPQLDQLAKDDAVVIRRSKKMGRGLSKRIRNTIIEVTGRISKRELAITKNMFYIVVAFVICFTPFIFCLLIDTKIATILLPYSIFLVFFNACINPAIYATKHPYFQKVLSKIIRCRWSEIPEPSDILRSLVTRG